ncbi:bifunctional hydroxymethylpyrimidine kinase/phosphomethylpyrimidine kinase [Carnobacterium antarcticum]|uniref:Hydroxymethylpyrimidine/phosphomethylpyrimidine kinase n=1 Tax=Carnobacterium antarcticum TaxID=2126436 RepID=A0ABW4NT91_9LACT|nr:bifunctional hydroxymethylpyrimidine kinase/phosphomethylpyrimidine kinase [Carnobacterium sp. CP1]ALV22522.1 Hydroxymethylpyrimidine phosphate kinase ThiD [Carnobacterium sp. CP1]
MIALTIAGSDSGGGAGIQADIKTFQELGVFGTTVVTALTAQNTLGVHGIFEVTPSFVQQQLQNVLDDFSVQAMKTGMLFSAEIIEVVAGIVHQQKIPLVVDPVMIAKGGASLLQDAAVTALIEKLLPNTTICTPNIPEAEILTGIRIKDSKDIERAAERILQMGVQCVVIKGGHLDEDQATDRVYTHQKSFTITTPRVQTKDTHGTGCTFSAALTANIAKGLPLQESIIEAKRFIHLAISTPLHIGNGHGPTNHFAYKREQGVCEVEVNGL